MLVPILALVACWAAVGGETFNLASGEGGMAAAILLALNLALGIFWLCICVKEWNNR